MHGPVSQFNQFLAVCPGANHLNFLYFHFSMHKMETMEASTSVRCLEDYIPDLT